MFYLYKNLRIIKDTAVSLVFVLCLFNNISC